MWFRAACSWRGKSAPRLTSRPFEKGVRAVYAGSSRLSGTLHRGLAMLGEVIDNRVRITNVMTEAKGPVVEIHDAL